MALSLTDSRKSGSIARLFPDKAYGFIYCPADARDYFFHQVHLEGGATFRSLQEGDLMTFVLGTGTKGVQAEEVRFEHHRAIEARGAVGVIPPKPRRNARKEKR